MTLFRRVLICSILIISTLFTGFITTVSARSLDDSQIERVELNKNNPFFQTTTLNPYNANPFLMSHSSVRQPERQTLEIKHEEHKITNPFFSGDKINITVQIRNPFLKPNENIHIHVHNRHNYTIPNQIWETITTSPQIVTPKSTQSPVPQVNLINKSEVNRIFTSKSDQMCKQYNEEIMKPAVVLPLTGVNSNTKTDSEGCTTIHNLVSGGTPVTHSQFPHMVALGKISQQGNFTFQCGGSLISPYWILSAAHCSIGPNGALTAARIGFSRLDDQHGITIEIQQVLRHPLFNPPAMYNDIALVKLKESVTFSKTIRPACLYQVYDAAPTQVWVTGWGAQEFAGQHSNDLRKAQLNIIDSVMCSIRLHDSQSAPRGVAPSMICAGDPKNGWTRDTCSGDSGGPLQVVHPREVCLFQIIGITSFGQGCAIPGFPGVYTRVSHYLNWIEENVWPNV